LDLIKASYTKITENKANQPKTIKATTRAIGKVKPQKLDMMQSSLILIRIVTLA